MGGRIEAVPGDVVVDGRIPSDGAERAPSRSWALIARFLRAGEGSTAIEYGLVASLIAAATVGAASALGGSVSSSLDKIASGIAAGPSVAPEPALPTPKQSSPFFPAPSSQPAQGVKLPP